jgi:transposase InsO family protein
MGIRDKLIALGSPWQNGYAERLIGSIRRECTDHIIAVGEGTCAGSCYPSRATIMSRERIAP